MKLNHINLPVANVAATRDFFTQYFGMTTMMEVGKNFLAMLTDDHGMVLNLSHFDKKDPSEIRWHKDFHVGFFVATEAEVDQAHARMIADGLAAAAPEHLEGRYSFYVQAPGNIEVEVAVLE